MEFQGHRTNSIIVNEISGSKENNVLVNGISSSKQKEFTCQWNVKVIEEAIYDLTTFKVIGKQFAYQWNFKFKAKRVYLPMEFQGQRKNSYLSNGISWSKGEQFTCQLNFKVIGKIV